LFKKGKSKEKWERRRCAPAVTSQRKREKFVVPGPIPCPLPDRRKNRSLLGTGGRKGKGGTQG